MGGVLFNHQGSVTITNSTLGGNDATGGAGGNAGQGLGGAIFNLNGTLTLSFATIAANTASSDAPGIYNLGYIGDDTGDSELNTYSATTLADGTAVYDDGRSVIRSNAPATVANGAVNTATPTRVTLDGTDIVPSTATAGTGTVIGSPLTSNPGFGPLASNGGDTLTMAIANTSPALNAAGACAPAADQRGITRPQGVACDIGAFELEGGVPPPSGGGGGDAMPATTTPPKTTGKCKKKRRKKLSAAAKRKKRCKKKKKR